MLLFYVTGSLQKYSGGKQGHILATMHTQYSSRGRYASDGSGAAASSVLFRIHGLLSQGKILITWNFLGFGGATDGVSGQIVSQILKALHLWQRKLREFGFRRAIVLMVRLIELFAQKFLRVGCAIA